MLTRASVLYGKLLFYSSIKLLVITWVDKINKLSDYRNTFINSLFAL